MGDANQIERKTMAGVFWSFIELVSNHGIQFLIQIILARLLLPEHFGIIGMIIIFIGISNTIIDSGFSQALIRDQYTTQEDYSTVFYFNIVSAIILYLVLYAFSPIISIFFNEPQLVLIIRIISLVLIFNALGIIHKVLLIKEVDFKTQSKVSIIAVLISGAFTITLALLGYGVWSLIINILGMQFIQTLLFWIFKKWTPLLTFKTESFKKYFNFSYKILIANLLESIYNNLFFLLIGKFYSKTQLGYYTNAVKISDLASLSIAASVQRVTYPILSSMQDEEKRMKSGFRKIIKMSAFINFPLMIGLAAIAHPLFTVLLGDKWIPSVVFFQLLCLSGMIYPLHIFNLNILKVKGRSELFLLIEVINKVLLTILITISFYFKLGVMGLISMAVVHSYVSLFINIHFSTGESSYSIKEQIKDLLPTLLVTIIMGVIVMWFGDLLPQNPLVKLSIQVSIGVIIYIAGSKLMKIEELTTTYELLIPLFKRIKHLNRFIFSVLKSYK